MRTHNLLYRKTVFIAASISCIPLTVAPAPAQSNPAGQNVVGTRRGDKT